jgi:hypothetical protein
MGYCLISTRNSRIQQAADLHAYLGLGGGDLKNSGDMKPGLTKHKTQVGRDFSCRDPVSDTQ